MGRATMASRLKRLEIATAASRRCTLCDRKVRVVYLNKVDGGAIADADISPCPECGKPPIVVRFVDMLPDEARERQRRAADDAGTADRTSVLA